MTIRQLVHYTSSLENVVSIIEHGFLLIPNRRDLLSELVDGGGSWEREPQETGMLSFTEVPPLTSHQHRRTFGNYGIGVAWSWAESHGADRVLYVRRVGPLFETFRAMFTAAYRDVNERENEGPISWGGHSVFNRPMAGMVGAKGWAAMLRLYEFMQPDAHFEQIEWRIVNSLPFTFSSRDKQEQIQQALSLAATWQTANLRLTPQDVEFFVCPAGEEAHLIGRLPAQFREAEVIGVV